MRLAFAGRLRSNSLSYPLIVSKIIMTTKLVHEMCMALERQLRFFLGLRKASDPPCGIFGVCRHDTNAAW